jgi:hypothetical protein
VNRSVLNIPSEPGNSTSDPSDKYRRSWFGYNVQNLVNEDSANVPSVTRMIRDHFGDPALILTSSNGLPIPDNSTTTGVAYWKVGIRKLFALLPNHSIPAYKRRHQDTDVDDQSDGSEFDLTSKRFRMSKEKSCQELRSIAIDVGFIREKIQAIAEVRNSTPVPLSLISLFRTTFKCQVCQDITCPPVMYACCCGSIVGCESCWDSWFRRNGEKAMLTEKCPHCQTPRVFAKTQRMKGPDDFLEQIKDLTGGARPTSSEDTSRRS